MTSEEVFGKKARWTEFPEDLGLPLIRKKFHIEKKSKATLTICGLGFFEAYLNGKRVSEDYLKPCFSDYSYRDSGKFAYPLPGEEGGHRAYVCRYEVGDLLTDGENALAVIVAGGWYTQREKHDEGYVNFGEKVKLCFSLATENGEEIYSDKTLRYVPSHIKKSNIYFGETVDYGEYAEEYFLPSYDDGEWETATEVDFSTPLYIQDVPCDRVTATIVPQKIFSSEKYDLYDVGKNVTGWVSVKGTGTVILRHAENVVGSDLDFRSIGFGEQKDVYIGLKDGIVAHPTFRWDSFRYFKVEGNVTDVKVEVLHIPFKERSSFYCDDENINKLYEAYKLTQLNNMHAGIPSDCPHREKLGYTADGQLITESALLCFDCDSFFRKWFADIVDCQDKKTGHVQHTAPLMGGGGGPGAWGGAVVFAPYKYYSVTGEKEYVAKLLPNMEKWIEHILRECTGDGETAGLVVRERKGGWCLGDWCAPMKTVIAEPFVNTYLFIKALDKYRELCGVCGKEYAFDGEREKCLDAIKRVYLDKEKPTCQRGVQGADFFFADLGLLGKDEIEKTVAAYDERNCLDVGIVGIEVLFDYLFKNGYGDVATRLLRSDKYGSFGYMFGRGATTLWESWEGFASHDHPMFGSVVKYLFTGIAGIDYKPAFEKVVVRPALYGGLNRVKASLCGKNCEIAVDYEKDRSGETYSVSYTGKAEVFVDFDGKTTKLVSGKTAIFKK